MLHMRIRLALAASLAILPIAACTDSSSSASPSAAASPAAPVVTSAAPSPSTNFETDTACKLASAPQPAIGAEIDEQTVRAITENAAKANLKSVMLAGVQLQGRYEAWLRADGDGEAAAEEDLFDAIGHVRSACIGAGVVAP